MRLIQTLIVYYLLGMSLYGVATNPGWLTLSFVLLTASLVVWLEYRQYKKVKMKSLMDKEEEIKK